MVSLNSTDLTEKDFLNNYDPSKYEKPSYTVDNLIFALETESEAQNRLPKKELKILLIQRKNHPDMNQWALPGGFIEMDENLEIAAARELFEETGLENVYLEQLYTYGDVHRDKRDRIISTAFIALINKEDTLLMPGDDASDAKWFNLKLDNISENKSYNPSGYLYTKTVKVLLCCGDIKLSSELTYNKSVVSGVVIRTLTQNKSKDIAFDHGKIILNGLDRLKNKLEYTDIAFNLLPEYFTLSELQQVYEIILNKQYSKTNFQRKFKHLILETNQVKKGKGYRPANLYKFNPHWDE